MALAMQQPFVAAWLLLLMASADCTDALASSGSSDGSKSNSIESAGLYGTGSNTSSGIGIRIGSSSSSSSSSISRRSLQQGRSAPMTIDPSVVLLFQDDVAGGPTSPCAAMVDWAAKYRGRTINFVATAYYADVNGDGLADVLGYRQSQANRVFMAYDQTTATKFGAGLAACMRHAVDLGFSIAVHIHLDDGLEQGTWRNSIVMDPGQVGCCRLCKGDAMLTSLAAVSAAFQNRCVRHRQARLLSS